jgi:hypothetical protein
MLNVNWCCYCITKQLLKLCYLSTNHIDQRFSTTGTRPGVNFINNLAQSAHVLAVILWRQKALFRFTNKIMPNFTIMHS